MSIRTILVDDEKLAIQGLQLRLEAHPDVEVIDTCLNGREAIRAIKTHKPDLVFLDIQMPGFDGFSVVSGLMEVEPPLFVFVTAYSDHAIRAFEAQATDYLMKPVEQERLADTMERVRQRLAEKRGVADRMERVGGSFFDQLSSSGSNCAQCGHSYPTGSRTSCVSPAIEAIVNRTASAPCSSISGIGASTLPRCLLILRPSASRM